MKGLHDAVINYTIEVVGIPVTQELKSTPESIEMASVGGYAGKRGRSSRHITEEIESGLISDDERTAEGRWE